MMPMGFVHAGPPVQEESLCRDSALALNIRGPDARALYPIADNW
jgi:hypothetical protein